MSELCEREGISRQTGYELVKRYREGGAAGLEERSRAPHHHGRRTPAKIEEAVIGLRLKRPHWGAKKLRKTLQTDDPSLVLPAVSTMTDILKRAGLVRERRRRRGSLANDQPFAAIAAANDTWCIDFKGSFCTRDGERIHPFTVTDGFSRYLLCCRIMPEKVDPVWRAMDRLFRKYGLPRILRSDNGTPFSSSASPAGLTRLSAHWLKLGIVLERIVPGRPQQNGRHERMHKTLKAETAKPPCASRAAQQKRFDNFRHDFNHNRPHEALGLDMPAQHYQASPRQMPSRIAEPHYDAGHLVRRVRSTGEIRWAGGLIFITEALIGEPLGIVKLENGDHLVRFAGVDLGVIDWRTKTFVRYAAGRPPRRAADKLTSTSVSDVSGT
jgi:transposase InsO family protein